MSRTAIQVEDLGKRYRIGATQERTDTLAGSLGKLLTQPAQNLRRLWRLSRFAEGDEADVVWALRDISFEVAQGEVVGIIGHNGAGKSTLLKILSRITTPSAGTVRLRRRVSSLLEVGTGFHPELTGRENVYLNGTILGMRKQEIDRKFDEIVAFSGVEKFIDTPLKRFSTGMGVRLAFSVAAHLEPEILLIDEVLAVGDAAFQKRCLGKMEDVAGQGRTVLFVSHNLSSVLALCPRAIHLDGGRLVADGPSREVVHRYLSSVTEETVMDLDQRQDRTGDQTARLVEARISTADGDKVIRSGSRLKISLRYRNEAELKGLSFLVGIYDQTNTGIYLLNSEAQEGLPATLPSHGEASCVTAPINLTEGRCYLNIALLAGGQIVDYVQQAGFFDVEPEDVFGTGKLPSRDWVLCLLDQSWSHREVEA